MPRKSHQYRKQLSQEQIKLLVSITTFRFITVPLLSKLKEKDTSTIYERLSLLVEQGYLHREYRERWRLYGKPAIYTIATGGIKLLRQQKPGTFSERYLKNQYKNKSASLQLMNRYVDQLSICTELIVQYRGALAIYGKAVIDKDEHTERPAPEIVMRRTDMDKKQSYYQLELFETGIPSSVIRRRLGAYVNWYDEAGFFVEDGEYPTLLIFCNDSYTEKRIQQIVEGSYYDQTILTTTRQRFRSGKKKVWLYSDYDEKEYRAL